MASSTLHAIAIAELRHTNPDFYREYCNLVEGITNLIRDISDQHANDLGFTSFTETFDHASNQPVLQIVISANKNELYLHIYIDKKDCFVIGKSGSVNAFKAAEQALKIIAERIKEVV
jgi:hypothetical protein